MAASLASAAGKMLAIDFDHRSFAEQGKQDSRAAGWIHAMDVEGDRVMASVKWTDDGRRALESLSYRFISPVFQSRPDGTVTLIEGAALVNNPALPQLRQVASKENDDMNPFETIAGKLGIAADKPDEVTARVVALLASETQLASIVTAAKVTGNDATRQICARLTAEAPDPAKFVTKEAFDDVSTQLASLQKTVTGDKVAVVLERAREAGKLTPAMEPWATNLASKDLGEFEAWEKTAPVVVAIGQRQLAGREPPAKTDALDDTERQVASQLGISEKDFLATRNAAVKGA